MTDKEIEEKLRENEKLVYYTLKRYYPTFRDDEDIIQCGRIGLWRAIKTFDPSRGLFSTHAVLMIRCEIRKHLRSEAKKQEFGNIRSLDEPILADSGSPVYLHEIIADPKDNFIEVEYDISFMQKILSERDFKILQLYIAGYKETEIAEEYKMTRSNVSRIIKLAQSYVRKAFQK